MNILTLDFETFYSTEYSLTRLTTEAYVRDPRFHAHMVGLQMNNNPPIVVPHERIAGVFEKLPWRETAVLAQHCMPGSVEVYTLFGWKRLDSPDVRAGTPILQWNAATEGLTWARVSEKQVSMAEKLLAWDSNFHKCAYTSNHRMYFTTPDLRKRNIWSVDTAERVAKRGANNIYIPISGVYNPAVALPITSLEARFLEAVRADGKLEKTQITFHFTKPRKIERLKWLCGLLGVGVVPSSTSTPNAVRFRVTDRLLVNKVNYFFPQGKYYRPEQILQLSLPCRVAILQEAAYWDGSFKRNSRYGAYTFATTDEITAEGFQLMAHVSGWSISGAWRDNNRGFGSEKGRNKRLYVATVRPRKMAKLQYNPSEVPHNSAVYCVTVPSHAFLIRSNDRVLITGNSHFDGLILSHHYGVTPALWLDTLSMFRAVYPAESAALANQCRVLGLPPKGYELASSKGKERLNPGEYRELAGYCSKDVTLTRRIFDTLKPLFPIDELRLIDLTIRLFTEPVLMFNRRILEEALTEDKQRLVELLIKVFPDKAGQVWAAILHGDKAALEEIKKPLASNPKFAEILLGLGIDPPKKLSPSAVKRGDADPEYDNEPPVGLLPKGEKIWAYAFGKTDEGFKHLLNSEADSVVSLVEARLGVKSTIAQTRTQRFIDISTRGTWPVYLKYAAAHTLRWGGGDRCLAENTKVTVLTEKQKVIEKYIQDVSIDDLVWDGADFVGHDGVIFQGEKEVISYDGLEATPDHKVWVEGKDAPVCLSAAKAGSYALMIAKQPDSRAVARAYSARRISEHTPAGVVSMNVKPVYDILNCGPRKRFAANGKIVSNCNPQNMTRGSTLRHSVEAPPGHLLVVRDLSAIEARVNAWLSGQEDMVDVFRRGEDVYCDMASTVFGRVITKDMKDQRFVGKTIVLGCLGENTLVLTNQGYKRIVDVTETNTVWDGEEWVSHAGAIYQGEKNTITAYGLTMTEDHEILTEHGWAEWKEVLTNHSLFQSAIDKVRLSSFPGCDAVRPARSSLDTTPSFAAIAGGRGRLTAIISRLAGQLGAILARNKRALKPLNIIGGMSPLFPTKHTALDCLTEYQPASHGATTEITMGGELTVGGGYSYTNHGARTEKSFSNILFRCLDGISHLWSWTASTIIKGTSQGTLGSPVDMKTSTTAEPLKGCNSVSSSWSKKSKTYDIAFAGPRNRFVVMSSYGPVIVHNCGYGLGWRKFQQMIRVGMLGDKGRIFGADIADALGVSVDSFLYRNAAYVRESLPPNVSETAHALHCACAQAIIKTFRDNRPMIPAFWDRCNEALGYILLGEEWQVDAKGVVQTCKEGFMLPSGMPIRYTELQCKTVGRKKEYSILKNAKKGERGKVYGGLCVENLVQRLSRDIIAKNMLDISKRYRIVMTTHDEIVCCVPEKLAEECYNYMGTVMATPPAWAPDIPLASEGGYARNYSK